MRIPHIVLAAAMLVAPAAHAAAQDRPIQLVPPNAPRWDVAGQLGWLGGKERVSAVDWYGAASGTLSVGYYWTPHVKIEADAGRSSKGSFYGQQLYSIPGNTSPVYGSGRHEISLTTGSAMLAYQPFTNQWVHPFIAAGAEVIRERDASDPIVAYIAAPDSRFPSPTVIAPAATKTSSLVRPVVSGGAKFYVSPHAFVRTDVRWTFDGNGVATVVWRGGVGFDF